MKINEPIIIKRPKEFIERCERLIWLKVEKEKEIFYIADKQKSESKWLKMFNLDIIGILSQDKENNEFYFHGNNGNLKGIIKLEDSNMIIDFFQILEEYSK